MVKVEFYVMTNRVGSKVSEVVDFLDWTGISQEDWDNMTEDEQQDEINQAYEEWYGNHIEGGAYLVD